MGAGLMGEGVAARLRAETREAHEAAEQSLDWEWRVADPERYRALLARMHGFHRGFEPHVGRALADEALLAPRRRLGHLARDLAALGMTPDAVAGLPACTDLPTLADRAEALGALYVVEGSTLGGQIIARRVARDLGYGPDTGCAYYAGHGALNGAMWRAFQAVLAAEPPTAADRMVASARATFEALRAWLAAHAPGAGMARLPAIAPSRSHPVP